MLNIDGSLIVNVGFAEDDRDIHKMVAMGFRGFERGARAAVGLATLAHAAGSVTMEDLASRRIVSLQYYINGLSLRDPSSVTVKGMDQLVDSRRGVAPLHKS
ncbi:hypothetical protein Aduo_005501 [Ancylostoma duodenale]